MGKKKTSSVVSSKKKGNYNPNSATLKIIKTQKKRL